MPRERGLGLGGRGPNRAGAIIHSEDSEYSPPSQSHIRSWFTRISAGPRGISLTDSLFPAAHRRGRVIRGGRSGTVRGKRGSRRRFRILVDGVWKTVQGVREPVEIVILHGVVSGMVSTEGWEKRIVQVLKGQVIV